MAYHESMTYFDHSIFAIAAKWAAQNHRFTIALVAQSWGSSPRPKGAAMLIREDGAIEGSVSGGCVEAEVIDAAQTTLATGKGNCLSFGVSDETAWSQGLSCGGAIDVLCLPVPSDRLSYELLQTINHLSAGRKLAVLTIAKDIHQSQITQPPDPISHLPEDSYHFALTPQRQLFIIGAGHIAQALVPMALQAGFLVHLIDPRGAFITEDRFAPHNGQCATLYEAWPSHCLSPAMIDDSSALVTLTHNPAIDDEGLEIGLASSAFYIASLGSKKTHAKRLERLAHHGAAALARIKGPAGLALGAKTPAEIAVSILAELIQAHRQADRP